MSASNLRGPLKLQVTPWRKGGLRQGLSKRNGHSLREGGEQSADWFAGGWGLCTVCCLHVWAAGIYGMWIFALSSSLCRIIISSKYIMFTKCTWPLIHYAKYKRRGQRMTEIHFFKKVTFSPDEVCKECGSFTIIGWDSLVISEYSNMIEVQCLCLNYWIADLSIRLHDAIAETGHFLWCSLLIK